MKNLKVYDQCEVEGRKFAILVNEEEKRAYEAVWNEDQGDWETDFSYSSIGIDSFNVAGFLDFDKCISEGYTF